MIYYYHILCDKINAEQSDTELLTLKTIIHF